MMKIGHKIKEIRKAQGITQKELAELLEVSPVAISQFEQKDNLRMETLER